MKYTKTFETFNKKIYHKDDIVQLSRASVESFCLEPYARIIKRHTYNSGIDKYHIEILFPRTTHWAYNKNDEMHTTFIENYIILKKLNKKEKEELLLNLATDKYNL